MVTEFDGTEEPEALVITEKLMRCLESTSRSALHPYALAAVGAALVILNNEFEDETEMEECIAESCRTLFELAIALMSRIEDEKEHEKIWQACIDIGKAVYGDYRVQCGASQALQELRSYHGEDDDESPHASTTLN